MAKFDAGTAVEALEYDFTKYGGGEGVVPEPTTGAVNDFFVGMRQLLKEVRSITANSTETDLDIEHMDPEEMDQAFDDIDEKRAETAKFQERSIALIADLCQGSPSPDDLQKLPIRVLRAFSKWLMGEINPKSEEQEATVTPLPAPRDRQRPGTKRSRKTRG